MKIAVQILKLFSVIMNGSAPLGHIFQVTLDISGGPTRGVPSIFNEAPGNYPG